MSQDNIEKTIVLKASRERAWSPIAEAKNFGDWFGVAFDGPFVAGEELSGHIVPTQVDADVAKMQEPHRGTPFHIVVETIASKTRFAFRWHPFAIDKTKDYSQEPTTLVTFALSDAEGGVLLTITETGFENIPAERRAQAFAANDGGWAHQAKLVAKYLAREEN